MSFEDFVAEATGGERPYPYQARLAAEGLPDVLRVPTGSGKTLAAVLPWLFRRLQGVAKTRWLVVVLPQRVLVEQTRDRVAEWVSNLGLDVAVHTLMGGEDREDREWKAEPERTRIFVGTQDMVLSRLLMRGYAESRAQWPVSFGLLHAGTQFVFDEVQLMGPGLPTSLQLQGLREAFDTALPCRSMWMSATLDPDELVTADFARTLTVIGPEEADRDPRFALKKRLDATRTIRRLEVNPAHYAGALAERVLAEHRTGTRTLVVLNTVDRAVAVYQALVTRTRGSVVLLHSRFRPDDRRRHTEDIVTQTDLIAVATQVLEAGVDLTSETMITEVAPWSSIVQRAGRCNRDGQATDPRLLWLEPPPGKDKHLPYSIEDLEASAARLRALEGQSLTGEQLAGQEVEQDRGVHPLLRRRDLVDLFDTAADLSGNDIDVAPFIRDPDDRTVFLAWRDVDGLEDSSCMPGRRELCPAPIARVRDLLRSRPAKVYDQREGIWRPAGSDDLRPSAVLVLDAARGGYDPALGFAPASTTPVESLEEPGGLPDSVETDPQSARSGSWVELGDHLADTETAAIQLLRDLNPQLTQAQQEAVRLAAQYHDLGKCHPVFRASLEKANPDAPAPDPEAVYAKSPSSRPLRHDPRGFRHELVSAVLLRDSTLLDGVAERDLVVYLALAHHGKVRVSVRGRPGEPENMMLGVRDGDTTVGTEVLPEMTLSLAATRLGRGSLADRALWLRDRSDLGPFRLAFCEALVRSADGRASAGDAREAQDA